MNHYFRLLAMTSTRRYFPTTRYLASRLDEDPRAAQELSLTPGACSGRTNGQYRLVLG